MKRFLAPPALVLLTLLAACSGGQAPRTAEFVPPAPAETDFGSLRVRYNALPALALSDAVAKQYGVQRDAGTALVLVASLWALWYLLRSRQLREYAADQPH